MTPRGSFNWAAVSPRSVPARYSRDPGGPLVLEAQESSGVDAEQQAAVLQQVQAEGPRRQDDFVGPLGHGQLHAVLVTARDRKPGKKSKRDVNKDKGPGLELRPFRRRGEGGCQEREAVW